MGGGGGAEAGPLVRLPPVGACSAVPAAAALPELRDEPWRQKLLSPVLLAPGGAACAPCGGPPRLRRPLALPAAVGGPAATSEAIVPAHPQRARGAAAPSAPSAPLVPRRKPPAPRVAAWRSSPLGQPRALTNGAESPQQTRYNVNALRPPSPTDVAMTIYMRDNMGPGKFGLWRSELDTEVQGHDAEYAEFANHRMDCQRDAQQRGREQAARWRQVYKRDMALHELRWKLRQHPEMFAAGPPADAAPPAFTKGHPDDAPPSVPRFPTPAPPRQGAAKGGARGGGRRAAELEGGEAEGDEGLSFWEDGPASGEEEGAEGSGSATPERRASLPSDSLPPRGMMAHQTGILRRSSLRLKQPWRLRQRRMAFNRRTRQQEQKQQAAAAAASSSGPSGLKPLPEEEEETPGSMQPDLRSMLSQRFRQGKQQCKTSLLHPTEEALRVHRVRDMAAVRRVFEMYDWDGNRSLDQAELRGLLVDLGLRARSQAEREHIRLVLRSVDALEVSFEDLVEKIIPRVRYVLAELNRETLRELFERADDDRSDSLSINELVRLLRLMGTFPSQALVMEAVLELVPGASDGLRTIDGELLLSRNIVNFEQFLLLAALLQERTEFTHSERARQITQTHELTPEQQALWGHDVVDIHASFQRFCGRGSDVLNVAHTTFVVHDACVLRSNKGLYRRLCNLLEVREDLVGEGTLSFRQLLELLSPVRRHEQDSSREVFETHCRSSGGLSLLACQRALRDCDVVARNEAEGQEIEALIEEYDEDGSGEVDSDEFERLVQYVAERLRTLRREAERQRVFQHNWSEEKYREYRSAFIMHAEAMADSLTREHVIKAVISLDKSWPKEELTHNLAEVVEPGQSIDILTFLDLMKAMEEAEALQKTALQAGLDKDSATQLCKEWKRLKPSKEGRVPWRRIKRLVNTTSNSELDVNFAEFVALVQKTNAANAERSSLIQRASLATRLKTLLH